MKTRIISALLAILAGSGMALAQAPLTTMPALVATSAPPTAYPPPPPEAGSPYWPRTTGSLPADVAADPKPACGNGACGGGHAGHAHCTDCPSARYEDRFWVNAEELIWWVKDARAPVLVSAVPGAIAFQSPLPFIDPVYGNKVDFNERSGNRLSLGTWFDDKQTLGIDASGFYLDRAATHFLATSNGDPSIGRTVFNTVTSQETLVEDAVPGESAGAVGVSNTNRLWGAEANVRSRVCACFSDRFVLFGGFRYLQLDEGLVIADQATVLPSFPSSLGNVLTEDSFGTHNRFYGGQIGAQAEYCFGRIVVDLTGKIALGGVNETVNIHGFTSTTTTAGVTTTLPAGLLALPTNSGRHVQTHFAAVPEATVNVGYQVTHSLRFFVGYNYLLISDVFRPGDEIDHVVNVTQVPLVGNGVLSGPARPLFQARESEFWAQGINIGLQFRY